MANTNSSNKEVVNLNELRWEREHIEASLDVFYSFAVAQAEDTISYYREKSRSKKFWAQSIRVTAIIATSLAGIIPLLTQIVEGHGWSLNAAWASVALGIAATALGLDRFFGFSTAWIRFITTEIKIQAKLQTFQLEWQVERLSWQGKAPGYDQARDLLMKCIAFINEVSTLVQDETQSWVQEFQRTISKLDERSNVQVESSQLGAISVKVENGNACDEDWILTVQGKGSQRHRGQVGVVGNLNPGLYKITVSGEINGEDVQAEAVVQVMPGQIAEVAVTLA
jgi:hypothetical protein